MKFSGHVQNGTRKKRLDFGCDHDCCLALLDPCMLKRNITPKVMLGFG